MNRKLLCLLGLFAAGAYASTIQILSPPTPDHSKFGDLVTITAGVTPITATGKVVFYDGVNELGTATLSVVSGVNRAQFKTKLLAAGPHLLSVRYLGDGSNTGSNTDPLAYTFNVKANASDTFRPAVSYNTGTWPEATVAGNFKSNRPDLVVANNGANTISYFELKADGTFKLGVPYPVGVNPRFLAVGDFNLDGNLDLAVANQGGYVSVLLGNGDGTFQPQQIFAAGSTPYAIAVADFNGDGKPDMAVADDNVAIDILLGNGDGTFQAPTVINGVYPSFIAATDVNNDGIADLVVANITKGNVSALIGDGHGNFGPPTNSAIVSTDPAAGHRPFAFSLGDFNSDGAVDLAVVDYGATVANVTYPPAMYYLRGLGNGSFTPADPVNDKYLTGNYPASVATGDFDGDGHLDVAVAASYSNQVNLFLGNGNGKFTVSANLSTGMLPTGLTVADFNGDFITDLAVVNFFNNTLSIFSGADLFISVSSGNNQNAKVKTAYASPLVALVKDGSGNPVAGVPVTFTAPASGASIVFTGGGNKVTVNTNALGLATSPTFKANNIAGPFFVTATTSPVIGSTPITASFTLTNTP